jgi:HPt (histidine-containing phosphotransfer) domain-containing protein
MDPIELKALTDALHRMWDKFLPEMVARLEVLETADAALAAGALSLAQRQEANTAAHKLAGSLGTFGLTKGTILAREAEMLYASEPETDPVAAARLAQISAQLRKIVENRK